MASPLLCSPSSCPSPLALPVSIKEASAASLNGPKAWGLLHGTRRRVALIVNASGDEKGGKGGEDDPPSFNPFGFVTDNPSSRSAIQLPESPAEDGNVGQMLYSKRANYGETSYWEDIYGEGSSNNPHGTIVFIHGAPTQSYSYRVVMSQGFIVGSYGLTWALKNSNKITKLTILNSPLNVSSPLPGLFQKLRIPLYGEFTCQNAVMAERFIEAGSPYVLKLEKADVYRLPYLASSGPGFALLEAARKAKFKDILGRIAAGFSSSSWDKPILLAWGVADKYLPLSEAEEFQKGNPGVVKLKPIEGAGHMPQEDWPEKTVEALRTFF
ncbi:uncharacterized protein [Elaeis guineensis]|uniref:uncharacterized protein isoform X5 n=1 Tax=Elaeis guineensis var. tenera TaxID=51953 RepID=UPI003C6D539A